MGLGVAVKATVPQHFSIVVFGLTQVALDLEVLWKLTSGGYPLHGFCHTYLGAIVVACLLAALGKPASQGVKAVWNRIAGKCRDANLSVDVHTTWTASLSAAFIGALSHILLDSLFHSDIKPLQPWSGANRFRGQVNPHGVEFACIVLGVIGLAWLFGREMKNRKDNKASDATSSPDQG
jgi:LexA-binding, inner membrane-associated putative hydrolase